MFFALAGMGLSALAAGMAANEQNEQAYQQAKLDSKRAFRQVKINRQAANDSYTSIQRRLNQDIKSALYKREAMLIKLTRARGTYAAMEGRTGKSSRRQQALETFGAWGRDSERLSDSMTDLAIGREAEMNRVSRQQYEADVNASAMVRPPAYTNPGLAIMSSIAGNLGTLGSMAAPNPYGGGGGGGFTASYSNPGGYTIPLSSVPKSGFTYKR